MCWYIFSFLCCDVRYDFRIKAMLSSSLPPVVCRRGWAHVLFTLFVVCLCVVVYSTYCVVFLFCCICLVASFSGLSIFDFPFSNVYFQHYFSYIAAVGFVDDVPDRKITNLPPFADKLEHVDSMEYMSAQEGV